MARKGPTSVQRLGHRQANESPVRGLKDLRCLHLGKRDKLQLIVHSCGERHAEYLSLLKQMAADYKTDTPN